MSYDRIIQTAATLLIVLGLLAAINLVPNIQQQRRQLNLVYDDDLTKDAPTYIVLAAALGSFRGLAADFLWYRMEQDQQRGDLHAALDTARWITRLQPRFESVWSFQAWNMAYNTSVLTHTPEERWYWVNAGINLLRDEGIPHNPRAVRLYRELSWIFLHKVGGVSDDMHRYYKVQLADEWQRLLGTPSPGATRQQVIDDFTPIAQAADLYPHLARTATRRPRLARADQQTLGELAQQHDDYAEQLHELTQLPLVDFLDQAPRLHDRMLRDRRASLARELQPIIDNARHRHQRTAYDPVALFIQDNPDAQPIIQQLQQLGFEPGYEAVGRIGSIKTWLEYMSPELLRTRGRQLLGDDEPLFEFILEHQHTQPYQQTLAFMRARALMERYHMDPQYMLQLMQEHGPMDWRHPASHAAYWASLGVDRATNVRTNLQQIDHLNTYRHLVHALQLLMRQGRINYDPFAERVDMLPDPRFIDSYAQAVFNVQQVIDETGQRRVPMDTFHGGHENFLIRAMLYSYIYGEDEQQARRYFDQARQLYGDRPENIRYGTYLQPMADLIQERMLLDAEQEEVTRPIIEALIVRAISEGLAMNRPTAYQRNLEIARQMHRRYQQDRMQDTATAINPQGRTRLPAFETMVLNTYIQYMQSPNIDLVRRHRVYQNTPADMASRAFPQFRNNIYQQAQAWGFDAEFLFPPPSGFDESQVPEQREPTRTPDTVERF